MNETKHTPWAGKRIAVVGMARSGRAVAHLLARHGARVRATDQKTATELGLDVPQLTEEGIELRLGGHHSEDLEGAEAVVVSPGIPKDAPILVEARNRGITLLSEVEVASRFALAPMAAVTGTNGKSTVVTVLGALLEALGRPVAVAGNVGRALSDAVETIPQDGVLSVEVSSFQLEDIDQFHPRAAAVLNITPDHMDRYASMVDYTRAKLRIFENQTEDDTAVIPVGDPALEPVRERHPGRVLEFGEGHAVQFGFTLADGRILRRMGGEETVLIPVQELSLPGPHNHANIAAALCLLEGLGFAADDPKVIGALGSLRGLPHRMEPVGTVEGVDFVNDSKATNPESLLVALRSFPKPVVLIAGGRAKGGDYAALAPDVRRAVALVVLIGEAAPELETAWGETGIPLLRGGTTLEQAVDRAMEGAREVGAAVVLFSPGCASFDMFRDYEERGDRFRELIRARGTR